MLYEHLSVGVYATWLATGPLIQSSWGFNHYAI